MSLKAKLEAIIYAAETPITLDHIVELLNESAIAEGATEDEVKSRVRVALEELIDDYAAAHRLPTIYEFDFFVRDGGLMSYGADFKESFERAASLVDRIFKGAKPADLPFEEPTRYLFVVNLNTAKSIGLELPPNLLALADEVIE